jgi:Leucine-rich repeat (LRR) protein
MYLVLPDVDEALESHGDKMRSAESLRSRLLAGLGVLNISKCGLTSLQGLSEVDGLEILFASDNFLTNLAFTGTLSALREMHVQNNSISSLRGLSVLPRIQKISLFGNPISCHQYYRLMVVLCAGRSLQYIDEARVTLSEREAANHLGDNVARLVRCGYMLAETPPSNPLPPKVLRCADLMVQSSVVLAQSPVVFSKAESPKVLVTSCANATAKSRPFSAESRSAAGGPMRVWSVVPGSVAAAQQQQQLKTQQQPETSLVSLLSLDQSNSDTSKKHRPSSPVVVKAAKHDKDWEWRTKVVTPLAPPPRLDDDPFKPKVYTEPPKKQPLPVQARGRAPSAERNQHSFSGDRTSSAYRQSPANTANSRPSSATRNRGNVAPATLDPKYNLAGADKMIRGGGGKAAKRQDAYANAADVSFTQKSPSTTQNIESSSMLKEWQWPGQSDEEANAISLAFSTLQIWWHNTVLYETFCKWRTEKSKRISNERVDSKAPLRVVSASASAAATAPPSVLSTAQEFKTSTRTSEPSDSLQKQNSNLAIASVAVNSQPEAAVCRAAAAAVSVASVPSSAASLPPSAPALLPAPLQKDGVEQKVLLYAAEIQYKGELVVGAKLTLAAKKNKKNTASVQLGLQFLWQRKQSEDLWLDIAPRAIAKASYLITKDDVGKVLRVTCYPSVDDYFGPPVSATIAIPESETSAQVDSSAATTPGTTSDTRVEIVPVSDEHRGIGAGVQLACTEPLQAQVPSCGIASIVWHVGKSPAGPWFEAPNGRSRVWNPTVNDNKMYVRIVVELPETHVGSGRNAVECVQGPLSLPNQLSLEIDKRLGLENAPFRSSNLILYSHLAKPEQADDARSRCSAAQNRARRGQSEVSS